MLQIKTKLQSVMVEVICLLWKTYVWHLPPKIIAIELDKKVSVFFYLNVNIIRIFNI